MIRTGCVGSGKTETGRELAEADPESRAREPWDGRAHLSAAALGRCGDTEGDEPTGVAREIHDRFLGGGRP